MTAQESLLQYKAMLLKAKKEGGEEDARRIMRLLCQRDLFFLLYWILNMDKTSHPWIYNRVREVQAHPDGFLDLWARGHLKTTIISFGLTIQNILNDPTCTFCFLAYNRPLAKAILLQIKREFENNEVLKYLFPDILWMDPQKEAPKWNEDVGIIVKRPNNPREATIEAFGLTDGQPTGRHYTHKVYDDVVTEKTVNTPEMIRKTTKAWELSLNLSKDVDPANPTKDRYVGTIYHYADTYNEIIKRGSVVPRVYPATDDGTSTGSPVFLTVEQLAKKRRDMGIYTFATQMLLDPQADNDQTFDEAWVQYWDNRNLRNLNIYILVDPASGKKGKGRSNDYTVFWVVGVGADEHYYIIALVRDRLNLTDRTNMLFKLHRLYHPKGVGYEEYGMQADKEHMEYVMEHENYRFKITPLGGKVKKEDRIKKLVPVFEAGRVHLPHSYMYRTSEGRTEDMIRVFMEEEYKPFPYLTHDDMFDGLARITEPDLKVSYPSQSDTQAIPPTKTVSKIMASRQGDW